MNLVNLLLVLAGSSYALSAVGTLVIFRIHGQEPAAMKVVKVLAVTASAVSLYAIAESQAVALWNGTVATALYTLAIALFLMAAYANRQRPLSIAFSTDEPAHLVTWGPYRYVRHPFYTSYLLAYAAALIGSWCIYLVPVVVGMAVVYTIAARYEERKFAASPLVGEFMAYRQRTGMFFPRK